MYKKYYLATLILILFSFGCSSDPENSGGESKTTPPGDKNETSGFVIVDNSSNPIIHSTPPGNYTGASWIDYNNDGNLDLFIGNNRLFRNNGEGSFSLVSITQGVTPALGNGNTWGDYDNDGDLDLFISSQQSKLLRNEGNGSFSVVQEGDIGDFTANRGWSSSWVDYDNDGNLDLFITHPAGFVPPVQSPLTNHLFRNAGPPDYTFSRVNSFPQTKDMDAFTVGSWSDYDNDGDLDLFIGSGPADGSVDVDNLFQNTLVENGTPGFSRITMSPIATINLDGQVWD
jgi:hypothetical protein